MSTIASRTFTQVFNDARVFLNDQSNVGGYLDSFLLPLAASGFAELETLFEGEGVPFQERTDSLSYVANATTIDTSTITGIYEPIKLWQRLTVNDVWLPVDKKVALDAPLPTNPTFIPQWAWVNNQLVVLPALQNLLILLLSQFEQPYPAAGSAVTQDDFYWALVYYTVKEAAASTGRDKLSMRHQALYDRRCSKALNRRVRLQQGVVSRPRAYRQRQ